MLQTSFTFNSNFPHLMFELSKKILEKVSFDRSLFQKELKKAYKWLKQDERMMLRMWCLTTFGAQYREVILEVFKTVTNTKS